LQLRILLLPAFHPSEHAEVQRLETGALVVGQRDAGHKQGTVALPGRMLDLARLVLVSEQRADGEDLIARLGGPERPLALNLAEADGLDLHLALAHTLPFADAALGRAAADDHEHQ